MHRVCNFIAASILLVLSAPVQLVTAIVLFRQLGAPVMFRQARAGQGGRVIVVPKFRTMTDARDARGALLPDAQRETRVTRLIRRLRLDELPQLLAVVRGRMALVGPRPLLPATVAGFGRLGELRNSVPPGLTGWAQISGNTHLDDQEKLALDLWYVAHRSLALDLRILAETALVPLRGEIRSEPRLRRAQDWLGGWQRGPGAEAA